MQIEIFIDKAGMQPPKQIKIIKGPKIKHFVANAKISYTRGRANSKIIYLWIKTKKTSMKLSIFSSPNAKFS